MQGTYGILLPCDDTEPLPISVGNHEHIRTLVGNVFDCVTRTIDPEDMGAEGTAFTVCGYIDDEGLINELPVNVMASIVFGRELYGPVVVVSGTNPTSGEYDGENYDVPNWFQEAVFDGSLHRLATAMRDEASKQVRNLFLAYADGVFTDEQMAVIMSLMASDGDLNPLEQMKVEIAIMLADQYAEGRKDGSIPKFDRIEFEDWMQTMQNPPTLSDDDIAKFWEEEGQ